MPPVVKPFLKKTDFGLDVVFCEKYDDCSMKTKYIAASIAASALMFLAWGCMELSTTETVKPIKAVTKENTTWGFGKKDSTIIKLVA